jgi:predicted nucleic acid-binding protein
LVIDAIALDASPLGRLVHPRLNTDILAWVDEALDAGIAIYLPEIIDYEVRRGLLAAGMTRSVQRLDEFKQALDYLPLTTPVMLEAADLWAQARRRGQGAADPKALDGDVILAAQARHIGATVVTENVGHLSRFVKAYDWRHTPVSELTGD